MKVAAAEKHRLEEKQRAARKKREKAKQKKWEPFYFEEKLDEVTKEKYYEFNRKYWNDRAHHNWEHLPDLFSKE